MKKSVLGFLLACLLVSPVLAATNTVNVSWKSPLVDKEGDPLPANAIASYDVLLATTNDMSNATVVEQVASVAGQDTYTAALDLTNGVWYISVQAIDIIGQKGLRKAPLVHATMVAPGEVRDLQVISVEGHTVSVGINVGVD